MDIQTLEISKINPAVYNPRKDLQPGDPEYEKLRKSIVEFDMVEPLVWNKRTRNLIGGHQRLKILKSMDIKSVEVSVVDLDEVKEKALNLALNKISGEWDFPKLKDLLEELDTGSFDMEITGFDLKEIADLMTQFHVPEEGLTDDDAVPGATESICRKGDLWKLGNHRLLCGDATIQTDVERLMGGEKADMVFTDPPYGINYLKHGDDKDWLETVHISMRNLDIRDGANITIFQQDNGIFELHNLLMKRFIFRQELIWLKSNSRPNSKLFFDVIENILWFSNGNDYIFNRVSLPREGFRWLYSTDRSEELAVDDWQRLGLRENRYIPNVFHYGTSIGWQQSNRNKKFDKDDRAIIHPTMKPVGMLVNIIESLSNLSNIIADLFGGSGSTLIACEKLDRRCFMMEIDEHYCDVIIKRWEDFTGKQAVLDG